MPRVSRRGVDGGWEAIANAYADILGAHEDAEVHEGRPDDRPQARADVRRRAGRHRQGRGDEQVRPHRRRKGHRVARQPGSHLRVDRVLARARSGPRNAREGDLGRPRARRPLREARRALRDEPRRPGERHSSLPAHLRRSRQGTRRHHRRARADLRAAGRLARARRGLSARARKRFGGFGRGGDSRQDRAPRRRKTRAAGAGHRDVEGRARPSR